MKTKLKEVQDREIHANKNQELNQDPKLTKTKGLNLNMTKKL